MNISIIYASQTGNTEMAAESIQDGILGKYPFIQVRLMDLRENEVDLDFLEKSEAVIFGTPVYFTSMSWELKRWFDQSFRIDLRGKLGAVFVTAQSAAGGTDTAIMEVARHMLAKGMLVCSGTGSAAKSKFQIGAVGIAGQLEKCADEFESFGANVAEHVVKLFGKP